jgi:hypothetical protein
VLEETSSLPSTHGFIVIAITPEGLVPGMDLTSEITVVHGPAQPIALHFKRDSLSMKPNPAHFPVPSSSSKKGQLEQPAHGERQDRHSCSAPLFCMLSLGVQAEHSKNRQDYSRMSDFDCPETRFRSKSFRPLSHQLFFTVMSQIRLAAMTSILHRFTHEVAENDGILPHVHSRES